MTATPRQARTALGNAIKYNRPPEDIAAAREQLAEANAEHAAADPVQLDRAARIVRIALDRGLLPGTGDAA